MFALQEHFLKYMGNNRYIFEIAVKFWWVFFLFLSSVFTFILIITKIIPCLASLRSKLLCGSVQNTHATSPAGQFGLLALEVC